MTLSEEAEKNKPKKPMPAYFRFRTEKLAEYKNDDDRNNKAKDAWEKIDPKLKSQYDEDYREQMIQYKADTEAWKKKYHVEAGDMKRKSKKKQDTDDEEKKPTKTKGTKQTKQEKKKSAEKKKEDPKKNMKSDKSAEKSKGVSKKDEKVADKGDKKKNDDL